jgi:hypothetical protein
MDDNHFILSAVFGVCMLVAAVSIVRGWLATARLPGG